MGNRLNGFAARDTVVTGLKPGVNKKVPHANIPRQTTQIVQL